jgi:hypothetical protein
MRCLENCIWILFAKRQPDTFQCIFPEIAWKSEEDNKKREAITADGWTEIGRENLNTIPVSRRYFNLPTEKVIVCQWLLDTSMAFLSSAGRMNAYYPINQWHIKCYHLRIFTYWNTDIRLHFCSARWPHFKGQVCNCVDLNCLFVASRVIVGLIAPLNSIERVIFVVIVTRLPKNYKISFAEVSLFQTLSMHKR